MSDATPSPTSVYLYRDVHDILIYVGVTGRGVKRNREHNATKEWWSLVARQEVEHYDDRETALARERQLITRHAPPFNRQHNPRADEVRTAYLLFAAAHAQPLKLRDAVNELHERSLPLEVHDLGDGDRLVLRTRLDHALISAALEIQSDQIPQVYGIPAKTKGVVTKLEKRGPVALLHTNRAAGRYAIRDAVANIKFAPSGQLVLINVQAWVDRGESCPPGSRRRRKHTVSWIRPDSTGKATA